MSFWNFRKNIFCPLAHNLGWIWLWRKAKCSRYTYMKRICLDHPDKCLAGPNCKNTGWKLYHPWNPAPTSTCIICKPPPQPEPNPPYIGTSCYQAINFSETKVAKFISDIAENGGNATEFFLCFTWQGGWANQPFRQIGWIKDDAFPGHDFPLFDLEQWNNFVWHKWLHIFRYCEMHGVVPFIRIHDYCSIKDRFEKRHYCFRSNKQRLIDGKLPGGLWGKPVKKYYSKLNKQLVDTIKAAGLKQYYIIPMNEADVLNGSWSGGEIAKDKACIDFHKWHIRDLKKYGVNKEHIIINTSRAFDELKQLGHIMEIHGCNSQVTMERILDKFGKDKIAINGDGPDSFARGWQGDKPTKREPSHAQAVEMGKLMKRVRSLGYDLKIYIYFNRSIEFGEPDINRAKFDALKGLVEGLK